MARDTDNSSGTALGPASAVISLRYVGPYGQFGGRHELVEHLLYEDSIIDVPIGKKTKTGALVYAVLLSTEEFEPVEHRCEHVEFCTEYRCGMEARIDGMCVMHDTRRRRVNAATFGGGRRRNEHAA